MLDLYCILGEHVYQISDLHQVHWFQKIEFGEVVVLGVGSTYEYVQPQLAFLFLDEFCVN